MLHLPVIANVSSSLIFTLMMEVKRSLETSVLTRASRHHNSEDGILHSSRRETVKSYADGRMLLKWILPNSMEDYGHGLGKS
jgi:hypothetical protein